jgi:hypothetical protein
MSEKPVLGPIVIIPDACTCPVCQPDLWALGIKGGGRIHKAVLSVIETQEEKVRRLEAALLRIQRAGNDCHPTAIWMQKIAAHALDPQWPDPGEHP